MSEGSLIDSMASGWRKRPPGALFAMAAIAMLTLSHWLYGGMRSEAAMLQVIASGVLLGGALFGRDLRKGLLDQAALPVVAAGFVVVVLAALWALTPFTPGGPHPAWAYVGRRGFAAVDPSATVVELIKLLGLGCLFLVGSALGASDKRADFALKAVIYIGAVFGGWAFLAFVSGDPAARYGPRLAGHFLSANTAATLFGALLILGVALLLREVRRARQASRLTAAVLPGSALLIFAACLISTASRAGMAATLCGLLIVGLSEALRRGGASGRAAAWSIGGLLALVWLVAIGGDRLIGRLFDVAADLEVRQRLVGVHWQAFLASPVNGYGLGSFSAVNRAYLAPENFSTLWNVTSTHNVYVQWLEEGGLAAAVPMFGVIGFVMLWTLRGALRRERMTGWLYALLAVDIVILLHGWTDFALQTPSVAGLWALLLGLQLALAQGSRRKSSPSSVARRMTPAMAALPLAACLGSILVLAALSTGTARIGSWPLLNLSVGHDRAAEKALEGSAKDRLVVAEASTREALRIAPFDTYAWLRLASIDRQREAGLSPQGLAAFQSSYDLVAYDPQLARWRVRFALENWTALNATVREAVEQEARVLAQDGTHRRYIRRDLQQISDPTGRMIAAFWLNRFAERWH